jgi:hypothetical protein
VVAVSLLLCRWEAKRLQDAVFQLVLNHFVCKITKKAEDFTDSF